MQIIKTPATGKKTPSFWDRLGLAPRPEPTIPAAPAKPAPANSKTTSGVTGKAGASVGGAAPRVTGTVPGVKGTTFPSTSGTGGAGGSVSPAKTIPAAAVTPSAPASVIDPLYIPNETQKQEAGLVAKLPSEFPILQWESMGTKMQQKVMEKSGLSPQDQWRLLNASTPLEVLSLVNTAQNNARSGLITQRDAREITDQALRYSDDRLRLAHGDVSILPPLQKGLLNRQLQNELEEIKGKLENKASKTMPFKILGKGQIQNQQQDANGNDNPNEHNIEMFNLGSKYPYKLHEGEYYFVEETAVLGPLLLGHTVLFDNGKYAEYKYIGVTVGKSIVPADHIWVKGCVNNVEHVQDYEGPFFNTAGGIGPFGVSASLGYNIDNQAPIISGSTVAQQLFAGLSISYLDYSCVNKDWVYGTAPISWGDTAYDHALGGDLYLEDA